MRRFFMPPEKISGDTIIMTGREAHHLISVLRCRQGDEVVIFDGTGRQWRAGITSIDSRGATLCIVSEIEADTGTGLELTVAQGYLKDKKMDALVRPLTELGVRRWIPFQSGRTVPVPNPKRMENRYERWRKISLESLKQCRRAHRLDIGEVLAFDGVLETASHYDLKILFWEQAQAALPPGDTPQAPKSVFLMFGPEGGFEPGEAAAARSRGFHICTLGPRILRAETAVLSACAIVQSLYGDMALKFS